MNRDSNMPDPQQATAFRSGTPVWRRTGSDSVCGLGLGALAIPPILAGAAGPTRTGAD